MSALICAIYKFQIDNWSIKLKYKFSKMFNEYCILLLVPSTPEIPNLCEVKNNSTSICVAWLKPQGGDAIDEYIVKLTSLVDPNNNIDPIQEPHVKNKTIYNMTYNGLQPGESVEVKVTARNSAGSGHSSLKQYATGMRKCIVVM